MYALSSDLGWNFEQVCTDMKPYVSNHFPVISNMCFAVCVIEM
jgi:hypothetical protein